MKRLLAIFRSLRATRSVESGRSFDDYAAYLRQRIERGEAVIR